MTRVKNGSGKRERLFQPYAISGEVPVEVAATWHIGRFAAPSVVELVDRSDTVIAVANTAALRK